MASRETKVPRVDETQGFAKKIEVDLPPADLALEFADPGLRPRQFGKRSRRSVRTGAGAPRFRASPTVQPGQAELPIGRPPLVEQLAGDPELPRNLRQTLPSPEPENRRFLERRRKYTHTLL
jgi:hypothetical protein